MHALRHVPHERIRLGCRNFAENLLGVLDLKRKEGHAPHLWVDVLAQRVGVLLGRLLRIDVRTNRRANSPSVHIAPKSCSVMEPLRIGFSLTTPAQMALTASS